MINFDTCIQTPFDLDYRPGFLHIQGFGEKAYNKVIEDFKKIDLSKQQFLPVLIDSYGGDAYTCLGLADFLAAQENVVTILNTKAMSAGAILFTCGRYRIMSKNAVLLFHNLHSWQTGSPDNVMSHAKNTKATERKICSLVNKNLGKPKWYETVLAQNKDVFFSARQAEKEGVCTHVGIPRFVTTFAAAQQLEIV